MSPQCLIQLAVLDPSGAVLTAVTYPALADSYDVSLAGAAGAIHLAFLATVAGACDGAFYSLAMGSFDPS